MTTEEMDQVLAEIILDGLIHQGFIDEYTLTPKAQGQWSIQVRVGDRNCSTTSCVRALYAAETIARMVLYDAPSEH